MELRYNFLIYFLVSVRVIAMLISSPVYSLRQIPSLVKVGISFSIAIIVANVTDFSNVIIPNNIIDLAITCSKEIIIGIIIGFISTLIFNAVRASAQLMDFSIGFSMAQYYDPSTSGMSTPLERLFNWIALIIFVTFNFHHNILLAIIKSFEIISPGISTMNSSSFMVLMNTFSNFFFISIQLAAPIVIVLFITDFTLGLIARTVPQLNVFILGMPLKVIVGLMAIATILPGLSHMYIKTFDKIIEELMKFFSTFPVILLMASDDKTEEATPKKLQEARKKGQVPKSVELNSAIILFGAVLVLTFISNYYYNNGRLFIIESFKFIKKDDLGLTDVANIFIYMIKNGLIAGLPVILTVMILGIVANIAQVGFLVSSEGLKPKLEKLNPIEGFKRIFSKRSIVELLKSIAKIALIFFVSYKYISSKIFEILKTSDLNPNGVFSFVKNILDTQLNRVIIIMIVIGITDFIFQKRQFKRDMRMTKQEVKEEYKQTEGDPQLKSKIRQKQRQLAMRRMMHEVPKATVVITNPTHYAVALKYERGKNSAPTVIAKGVDVVALRIKEIAKENSVPIVENKALARALYAKVEIDQSIPMELYQAVAEILAYVYSLKKM
ncbi:flagellar biosynthesis protein FliR [Fervidicella metallireducens AeB]|uniref:Flagellar biosynthetic protein FliR n=1 Tax=Fervidicella metallireducens AeB TaxID=1403537 RepID=A0A017RVU2_9CLOT|nr:flagellar biosynthesis protein FlhB [Fervidicella metallireducens]EYE88807.1 flagellar biosynthesis protein FliR [Fervidicella metallireducens AeB]